jgi:uncharacterized membrane protein YccC
LPVGSFAGGRAFQRNTVSKAIQVLNTRTKEAIKTALAMVIAYQIALSMNWDKPYWAGFAVAFISLATVGQSLNKGALRMAGTIMGAIVSLTLIGLFAQERWLFILSVSLWVGICTYMMGGPKHQYFWNVGGFVCVIIAMDAGPNSVNAFDLAMLRAQETGLGILVYTLVSVMLWPSSSRPEFYDATAKLAATQHRLYRAYLGLMNRQEMADEALSARAQESQEQAAFGQLLDAAVSESYEVWELRRQWRRYRSQVADLTQTMERWRESITEVQALDLERLLPNLAAFGAELDGRFAQIGRMLANQPPERQPTAMDLSLNKTEVRSLSHFHKAALTVTRSQLQHLEQLTRSLFSNVGDMKGFGQAVAVAGPASPPGAGFVPDPDRLAGMVRVIVIMWLAFLALIYVQALPGGAGFVGMAAPFGMALATSPQLPVSKLFLPVAFSVLFAGVLYIFLMPQLSSFVGLGLMIFLATFLICYMFHAPQQALGRTFGLAMFVTIASISNQQTYSFLVVADTAMMFLLMFPLILITVIFPFDLRPERAFLRLVSRYFRSGEYLMSTMQWGSEHSQTRLDRWRKAFHTRELSSLPAKLGAWSRFIDTKKLSTTSPEQVQALVFSLQALTYRMQELLEARQNPQSQFLVEQLLADIRSWRLRIQNAFQRLSENPAVGDRERFSNVLNEILAQLESRTEEVMNQARQDQISDREGEFFYRLLGAYRGVSEALVDYAGSAGVIGWTRWREERF